MTLPIALLLAAIVAATTVGRSAESVLRMPWLTIMTCVLLAICFLAQVHWPNLLSHAQRDESAIQDGEFHRLFTALWFQDGAVVGTLFNIAMLALIGIIAEQSLSGAAWLGVYLIGGILSQVVALAWQPVGAGNSVAYMSLVGALLGLAFYRRMSRGSEILAGLGVAAAILLCLRADIHGAAVLIGCALLLLTLTVFPGAVLRQSS